MIRRITRRRRRRRQPASLDQILIRDTIAILVTPCPVGRTLTQAYALT